MRREQRGFTLIELMISLVLGLVLAAGISELFNHSQKSHQAQRSLGIMMEDGSYILGVLSKELRQAGFLRNRKTIGGSALEVFQEDSDTLGSSETNATIDIASEEYIHGVNENAFAFRYQLGDADNLAEDNSNSPCEQDLALDDDEDPSIDVHLVTLYFYVSNDDLGVPTLYCRAKREIIDNANTPPVTCIKPTDCSNPDDLPLLSNVERMVVKYGVREDPNDTPNDQTDDLYYYTTANDISDWKKVVTAKIFVVMRSEDDNLSLNPMYHIENTMYQPVDNRFYRVFSTTVVFRNLVE